MEKRIYLVLSFVLLIGPSSSSPGADLARSSGWIPPDLTGAAKALTWTELTASPTATGRSAIGWIGDYVYVFGNDTTPDVALYWHVPTETWGNSTPYPGQGHNWTGTVLGGELYVLGRHNLSNPTNEFRKFTPDGAGAGTWSQLANYPLAVSMLAVAADTANGLIYAAGGYTGSSGTASAHFYDVAGDSWSILPPLPQPRLCCGGAVLNGKFYVLGGLEPIFFTYTNTLYEYDPGLAAWSSRATAPRAIGFNWSSVTTDGNRIYQIGGGGGYALWPALNAVQVYHAASDSWFLETPLPAANGTNSAVWVGGPWNHFLSTGGWAGTGYTGQTFKGVLPDSHDVGVQSIDNPGAGIAPNVSLNPQATFKNYGLNTETFPVTVTVDSADVEVYSDTGTVDTLAPEAVRSVTFTAWTPGGPGNVYTVCARTELAGDQDPTNDTLCQATMTYSYYEDFEASNGEYTPDPPAGGWQWGAPASGPGGAHSGANLWATILAGNYFNNADWRLRSRDFIVTFDDPVLEFWHWYDMEYGYDGGNVKSSTDWGVTWQIITPVGGYPEPALDPGNAGIPGEPAYSSDSGGWELAHFDLSGFATGTFFRLRWHFGSDASVVSPGWYVDDVYGFGFQPMTLGAIEGTVTDSNTGDSLQGAIVTSLSTGHTDTTDVSGHYFMDVPPISHDLRAEAPSYNFKDTTGIAVVSAETTTVDIALTHCGAIDGTVTDLVTGDSIAGAIVTSITVGVSDTTDTNGYYLIEVPDASHDMHVEAPGYGSIDTTGIIVSGPDTTTVDFALGYPEILIDPVSFRVGLLPDHHLNTCLWIYNVGTGRLDFDIDICITVAAGFEARSSDPQGRVSLQNRDTGRCSFSRTPSGWDPPTSLYPGEVIEQHPAVGDDPTGFEFDETNRCFWQGAWNNYIYQLDTNFVQIAQHLEFGTTSMPPTGLAWRGGYLYQANYDEGRVYVIDVSTWTAVDTIYSPGGANLLGVEWVADRLWLSDDDMYLYECDSLGNLMNQYTTYDSVPFGLAYFPLLDTLYLCGWSLGDIYSVDPHTGNQYVVFPTPGSGGDYSCSGASWDNRYHPYLWIAHQTDRQLYLTDTGNKAWIDVDPASGSVPPADTFHVAVIFNSTGLTPGLYLAELRINNNSATTPVVVPCTLDVYAYGLEQASGLPSRPQVYSLSQNAPNPTHASTSIDYQLPATSKVSLKVYNASGRLVRSLVDAALEPGYYTALWDGRDSQGRKVPSGVYFYRLSGRREAGDEGAFEESRKLVLLR